MAQGKYFLILFVVFCSKSFANDGSYSSGPQAGTLYPVSDTNIRMLEELVEYDQARGAFTTSFVFYNTSDTKQKVIVAFPVVPSEDSEEYFSGEEKNSSEKLKEINEKLQFKTWIDGKQVDRELWKVDTSDSYRYAFMVSVTFLPKEKKKVVNKFNQGFGYGGSNNGDSWKDITYILKTGAGWKGTIGKARVEFKMSEDIYLQIDTVLDYGDYYAPDIFKITEITEGWVIHPKPSEIKYDEIIIWEFEDFEPDSDIVCVSKRTFNVLDYFDFLPELDTLAMYIINNDSVSFNKYIKKIKKITISKKTCRLFYEQYADYFLIENKQNENFEQLNYKSRHIVNALAALNGYEFSNKMWADLFSLYKWYEPSTKNPSYTEKQTELIKSVKQFESGELYAKNKKKQTENKKFSNADKELVSADDSKEKNSYLLPVILIVVLFVAGLLILFYIRSKKNSKVK